jgi:hypothetical protein
MACGFGRLALLERYGQQVAAWLVVHAEQDIKQILAIGGVAG